MLSALFRYMVNNIQSDREFVIDLEVTECYETNGPCSQTLTLAKDLRIPYPVCANGPSVNTSEPAALYKGKKRLRNVKEVDVRCQQVPRFFRRKFKPIHCCSFYS